MKLYYLPGACSLTVHITLNWCQADYQAIAVDHDKIKQTDYLQLNPQGAVPCLVDGDFVLTQNVAIAEYLNEKFPAAHLWGNSIEERAQARRWMAFCNSDLHPAFGPLFAASRMVEGDAAQQQLKASSSARIMQLLGVVNAHLQNQSHLGASKSPADAYLFVMLGWLKMLGMSIDSLPALVAFAQNMAADAGVLAAMRDEGLPTA